jgi:hypothetical protein
MLVGEHVPGHRVRSKETGVGLVVEAVRQGIRDMAKGRDGQCHDTLTQAFDQPLCRREENWLSHPEARIRHPNNQELSVVCSGARQARC